MLTRRHPDSKVANPTIVPRFPRPFDGKKTVPPQVLTVNPADTIGKVDDTINDIPRARDRVLCECGVELTRSYLEKHRLTAKHSAAMAALRKATKANDAKQKKGVPNGQARATASGKPNEHSQNDADSDVHEYTAFDRTYFDADDGSLMTNPYYYQDAYIHG